MGINRKTKEKNGKGSYLPLFFYAKLYIVNTTKLAHFTRLKILILTPLSVYNISENKTAKAAKIARANGFIIIYTESKKKIARKTGRNGFIIILQMSGKPIYE